MVNKKRSLPRITFILFVNLLIFISFFLLIEFTFRIHRDGFIGSLKKLTTSEQVPYSNLGTSNWVIFDEDLGYRLNPLKDHINNLSIRHGEIKTPKPKGLFRIVILGDSIPWDEPGFVSMMKTTLEKQGDYEIINASVPGYTAYQEVLFYKKYLSDIEPDLVIWSYCLNDNHKFLHKFDRKGKMLWTDEAKNTFKIHSKWNSLIGYSYVLSSLKSRFIAKKQLKKSKDFAWENTVDFNIAWKDFSWNDYEKHFITLKDILSRQNSELAVIIFPFEPQLRYRHNEKNFSYALKPQKMMAALCHRYQTPLLDLYPAISNYAYKNRRRLFRDGVHLNPTGHKLVTKRLIDFLSQKNLIGSRDSGNN